MQYRKLGRGSVKDCEFGDFTLVVQLDLIRLTNHTMLSAQREDEWRNRECIAASRVPSQQGYKVWRFHLRGACKLLMIHYRPPTIHFSIVHAACCRQRMTTG